VAQRHAPVFGADSSEVLREAGLTDEEIAALVAEGAVVARE
jgi:crotonobetainyl-CoA:carnitine CoA-transferase CaiB-like acyl-CoA transferase